MSAAATILKLPCPHCGVHIEFPASMHGRVANCPDCSCSVALQIPGYYASPPPIAPAYSPGQANVKRKGETAGVGCLVELIGLILLFFFPIGTIVGVITMIAGHFMSYKWICDACGTKLAGRRVRECPSCHRVLN